MQNIHPEEYAISLYIKRNFLSVNQEKLNFRKVLSNNDFDLKKIEIYFSKQEFIDCCIKIAESGVSFSFFNSDGFKKLKLLFKKSWNCD